MEPHPLACTCSPCEVTARQAVTDLVMLFHIRFHVPALHPCDCHQLERLIRTGVYMSQLIEA